MWSKSIPILAIVVVSMAASSSITDLAGAEAEVEAKLTYGIAMVEKQIKTYVQNRFIYMYYV